MIGQKPPCIAALSVAVTAALPGNPTAKARAQAPPRARS